MDARNVARFRRLTGLILAGVAMLYSIAGAAQSARIGYVDMKRLLDNAPQVIETRRMLGNEFKAKDAALKAEEARLAELESRERRDALILPKPAAESLRREIDALRDSITRTRNRLAKELKAREDEEFNRQWPLIEAAVIAHAREQQLDLIVQSPVFYASAQIDITDAVLVRLRRDAAAPAP